MGTRGVLWSTTTLPCPTRSLLFCLPGKSFSLDRRPPCPLAVGTLSQTIVRIVGLPGSIVRSVRLEGHAWAESQTKPPPLQSSSV